MLTKSSLEVLEFARRPDKTPEISESVFEKTINDLYPYKAVGSSNKEAFLRISDIFGIHWVLPKCGRRELISRGGLGILIESACHRNQLPFCFGMAWLN